MNLRDRDNLRAKDKRPVPKVSFVRRLDCSTLLWIVKQKCTRNRNFCMNTDLQSSYFSLKSANVSIFLLNFFILLSESVILLPQLSIELLDCSGVLLFSLLGFYLQLANISLSRIKEIATVLYIAIHHGTLCIFNFYVYCVLLYYLYLVHLNILLVKIFIFLSQLCFSCL